MKPPHVIYIIPSLMTVFIVIIITSIVTLETNKEHFKNVKVIDKRVENKCDNLICKKHYVTFEKNDNKVELKVSSSEYTALSTGSIVDVTYSSNNYKVLDIKFVNMDK